MANRALGPVIVENVNTGRVGSLIHELIVSDDGWKGTRCGIDAYDPSGLGLGSVQLSVEPDGTRVTCVECVRWRETDGRVPMQDVNGKPPAGARTPEATREQGR